MEKSKMHEVKTRWVGQNPFKSTQQQPVVLSEGSTKVKVDANAHAAEYVITHGTKRGCWPSLYGHLAAGKTLEIVCNTAEVKLISENARGWVARHGRRIQVTQKNDGGDGRGRVFLKGGTA
jgi:hypothetical protein